MRRRQFLQRSPIFAAAGFIGFLFLSTLWNYAVERHSPQLRIRSAHPLAGLAKPGPTPVSFEAFFAGETQKAFSTNLGRSLPIFPISVRAKNQFLYSLFDVSGAPNILIGKNQQLYERFYIDEFCKRDGVADSAAIDHWAKSIRESQDAVDGLGKSFVYLITPSKAAQYPQYLPQGLFCPALAKGTSDKLRPFRGALDALDIRYVDAPKLLAAGQGRYPIDLFPRGGTHWNLLAASLATQEMTRALSASLQGSAIGQFSFDWKEAGEAEGTDRDLLDLLNLASPDARYPVARIARRGALSGASCERAPRIAAMGGSFLREIIAVLAQAPCPPEIDHWFYMRTENDAYELVRYHTGAGDVSIGESLPSGALDLRASLDRADIVLLEENEAVISRMQQVANLRQAMAASSLTSSFQK